MWVIDRFMGRKMNLQRQNCIVVTLCCCKKKSTRLEERKGV